VLGTLHHVAYVARDLRAGIATLCETYGLAVAAEHALPAFGTRAAMLRGGGTTVEVLTLDDPELLAARLAGQQLRLDHLAHEVADIERAAARLRAAGARFIAPDGSSLDAPLELGGARHLWTAPAAAPGVCVQLVEPAGPADPAPRA